LLRFLVSAIAVAKETGFLDKHLGWDAKVIAETRFLGEGPYRVDAIFHHDPKPRPNDLSAN
jgi:hypothetical protein